MSLIKSIEKGNFIETAQIDVLENDASAGFRLDDFLEEFDLK